MVNISHLILWRRNLFSSNCTCQNWVACISHYCKSDWENRCLCSYHLAKWTQSIRMEAGKSFWVGDRPSASARRAFNSSYLVDFDIPWTLSYCILISLHCCDEFGLSHFSSWLRIWSSALLALLVQSSPLAASSHWTHGTVHAVAQICYCTALYTVSKVWRGDIALLQRNLVGITTLVKWSSLTSPIIGQTDIMYPLDALRTQLHLWRAFSKNVWLEYNKQTIRRIQIEGHSAK